MINKNNDILITHKYKLAKGTYFVATYFMNICSNSYKCKIMA